MTTARQGVGNMPVGVAIIGMLTLLNGVATLVIGSLWLWLSADATDMGGEGMTTDQAQALGWTAVAAGVLTVLVGIGLLRGSRLARFLVMTLMVLRIGIDVFALLWIDGYPWVQGAVAILWAGVIIGMLTTRRASLYFMQR
ncbi:hypothetical protein [Demequina sp.]|uniref:DUF7144 family membrane protein n=1 Tax=Demequina sp. TaxID=2050685 RepID=UPI003A8C09D7